MPAFGDKVTDASAQLADFIYDRLAGVLREQGASAQEVDAVLALRPQRLADVAQRLQAVRAFASLPEAPALAAANKRIGNILKKSDGVGAAVNAALLAEPAEQALAAAIGATVPDADGRFEQGDYTALSFTVQVHDRMHLARVVRAVRRVQEVVRIGRVKADGRVG